MTKKPTTTEQATSSVAKPETWTTSVVEALTKLGGRADLSAVYSEVEKQRAKLGLTFGPTWHATVRRTIQECVLTEPVEGKKGHWKLAKAKNGQVRT